MFARVKHPCQRPPVTLHGVVFDILVGSENHVGYLDLEQTLQPLDNPFGTRLSPMSWVRGVTYVSGLDKHHTGGRGGLLTRKSTLDFAWKIAVGGGLAPRAPVSAHSQN